MSKAKVLGPADMKDTKRGLFQLSRCKMKAKEKCGLGGYWDRGPKNKGHEKGRYSIIF